MRVVRAAPSADGQRLTRDTQVRRRALQRSHAREALHVPAAPTTRHTVPAGAPQSVQSAGFSWGPKRKPSPAPSVSRLWRSGDHQLPCWLRVLACDAAVLSAGIHFFALNHIHCHSPILVPVQITASAPDQTNHCHFPIQITATLPPYRSVPYVLPQGRHGRAGPQLFLDPGDPSPSYF